MDPDPEANVLKIECSIVRMCGYAYGGWRMSLVCYKLEQMLDLELEISVLLLALWKQCNAIISTSELELVCGLGLSFVTLRALRFI